jgi:hypothetical protein
MLIYSYYARVADATGATFDRAAAQAARDTAVYSKAPEVRPMVASSLFDSVGKGRT